MHGSVCGLRRPSSPDYGLSRTRGTADAPSNSKPPRSAGPGPAGGGAGRRRCCVPVGTETTRRAFVRDTRCPRIRDTPNVREISGKNTTKRARALARASRRGEAFNPHVHSNLIINWNCFQLLITSWLIILEHADVTRHVQTDALVSGLNMSMIKLHVTCTRERYGEFMVCWYHRESGPR
jgi:hypothetical protein